MNDIIPELQNGTGLIRETEEDRKNRMYRTWGFMMTQIVAKCGVKKNRTEFKEIVGEFLFILWTQELNDTDSKKYKDVIEKENKRSLDSYQMLSFINFIIMWAAREKGWHLKLPNEKRDVKQLRFFKKKK
jgi:hypothetical protein